VENPPPIQDRLTALISNSPAILYRCAASGDYGATFISDNVHDYFGHSPEAFTQDAGFWANCLHPDDAARVFAELASLFERGHHSHEYRFRHQDGTYRWVRDDLKLLRDAAGDPIEIVGAWLDITQEKLTGERLQQSTLDLHQQLEWQRLVMEITQRIRQSLNLDEILNTTVAEVREFLHTDRVLIFRFDATWKGQVITESVGDPWRTILSTEIFDPCFADSYVSPFQQGQITAKPDIHTAGIDACHLELLTGFQVRANLVVPILQGEHLWGLLIAHHCAGPRHWQPLEIDLLRQLATQVGLAIQQADLFAQVQSELRERQRTEEALRQSEERWQLAIAGSKDGIWDYDFRNAEAFLSDHCLAILGHPLEAIDRFEKWLSFIHPDDLAAAVQAWEAHQQGHSPSYSVEYRLCRADGTYRWIQVRGQALWDERGQVVRAVGSVTDISDRKRAEAEIRALNADLEQRVLERTLELRRSMVEVSDLYTNAPCGYHSLDATGTFVRINDTALNWLGYTREELLHRKKFSDLLTPASLQVFQANFPLFKERGWVSDLEFELICKDGSILPVSLNSTAVKDADGSYVTSRTSMFDIRARKQTEDALREADRRWRSLLEDVRLVVVGLDRTGRVEFANPFFLEVTGYSLSEVLGQDWFTTFLPVGGSDPMDPTDPLPLDPLTQQQIFYETLEQNFQPYSQAAILTKAGDIRQIAWNHTLLRTAKGAVIGTMSIGEDITQRKVIERLKDEFISIVSHELRTPLTSLRGALGLLATGILNDSPREMNRMIEIAALDSERLVRLVNDILDLERLESGKIALSRTFGQTLPLLQRSREVMLPSAQEAGVTVVIAATPTLPVWADSDRLIQTLTNLLSNAIKFSPPGSTVTLSAARINVGEALRRGRCNQDCVLFQVQDHGRGIPADKLESVFGRFQQVDASDARLKGGTGLGLAICQSIVQQHGGEIWVDSRLGQGSTFFFTMPLPPEPAQPHAPSSSRGQ
jgi:PAS domain S-box-containing protein